MNQVPLLQINTLVAASILIFFKIFACSRHLTQANCPLAPAMRAAAVSNATALVSAAHQSERLADGAMAAAICSSATPLVSGRNHSTSTNCNTITATGTTNNSQIFYRLRSP